uniref:Calponin-homology (CH) domain-containing protein n=1 Tax=Globodera pallida TaxID=36090 RepID=A0A183C9N9_GLOPA
MEKETNFAHQMRMLRLENPANNGKIAEIKKEIEQQFVGPNLMRQIEFKFPIYMAIDIIDDIKLGMHYAELLSRDEETRNNAELLLSNRIFSARIWTIFFNTYLLTKRRHISHNAKKKDAKTRQILAQIQTIWRHGLQERRGMQNILPNNTTNDNLNASLAPLHDQWLQLANLYNQMPLVARDERVQIAQPQHQHVRHQLSDEHAENMIRLASTKNAFSDCLQNSLFEGKGTKIRARWFFTFNSEETMGFYDAFVSKYPQIETLTRTELTDDEITQLQIQTYIKFFDHVKKIRINMHMELLELFMDSASEVPIDQLKNEDYEINFTKHFNEIRAEVLPKLIPKCDGTSIEAVLAQRNLHDEVLTKLLLNNEFVKQLKTGLAINSIKSAVPRPSDADRHWTKPECHKAEVVDSTQHKLFNTPQLITWHTGVVLGHLVQKCPSFVQFVNKIVPKVASISNYGQLYANERILLYKTILGSTDTEAIKENENALNASSDTVFCDDDELSKLARLYQNVMAQQNSVPSDSLNFETAYFYHKTVVKELMDYIGLVQRLFKFDNSNQNVKRMIIQLNVEVAKCDLFANVADRAQKMENLCLMDSLLAHLLNNGTMFTAIGQWQQFLTEKQFYYNRMIIQLNVEVAKCDLFANVTDRAQKMENLCLMDSLLAHLLNNGTMFTAIGQWQSFLTEKQFYNNSAVPRPSDADRHWTKPECHKAEVVDSTQHKLFNTPQLIIWHTGVVLGHLVQKCPSFVQFVNKIVPKVASISNYGKLPADERILLYKTMLGSTDTEATKMAEGLLAIKTFFAEINEMEQANFGAEKFGQIANGRAELFGTFRMVKVERPTTFWHNKQQLNCYKTTIVEHFELQRKALGQIHMAFFTQFLIKNANENDLVKIVRESPGAILRLRNLLDTKIDNFMLNENNVRQRLINWNS